MIGVGECGGVRNFYPISSRQIEGALSIADVFPPNRGVHFLLPISSRQIEECTFFADFFPPNQGVQPMSSRQIEECTFYCRFLPAKFGREGPTSHMGISTYCIVWNWKDPKEENEDACSRFAAERRQPAAATTMAMALAQKDMIFIRIL